MMDLSNKLQSNIEEFASLIGYIISTDVEVVDDKLNLMAKQNPSSKIDERTCSAVLYENVMETKSFINIDNPRRHRLCIKCPERNRCLRKLEMAYPIIYDDTVLGAIGIVTFNSQQRDNIIKNLDIFTAFINTVIDLIINNLKYHIDKQDMTAKLELLKTAIDTLDRSYIIYDGNYNILDYNAAAKSQVSEDIKTLSIMDREDNTLVNKIMINDSVFNIIGTELKYFNESNNTINLLVFSEVGDMFLANKIDDYYSENDLQFIGKSEQSLLLKDEIKKLSKTDSIILITGNKGVGKEHSGRMIKKESNYKHGLFVKVDCKEYSIKSMENEIFGNLDHREDGIYPGKIRLSNRGVLFLENVEFLPEKLFSKLINIINKTDEKLVKEYGNLDIKLILSTERDRLEFENMYGDIDFSSILSLEIPDLKDRKGDSLILFNHFNKEYRNYYENLPISKDIIEYVKDYDWPNNISELQLMVHTLYLDYKKTGQINKTFLKENDYKDIEIPSLQEIEYEYIKKALKKYGDTTEGKKQAADDLGIGIATLYRKIKEYNIN